MTKFTHKKKARYAMCMVWDGTNTELVIETLERVGCESHKYGDATLMLRWKDDWHRPSIEMMEMNKHVIRIGEDDSIKIITIDEMNEGYEPI